MSDFIDKWVEPGLWLLGDWSLRWGVLIVFLGLWFAVRPPRQAGMRLAACQLVLLAGLALPTVPRWWGHGLLPSTSDAMADDARSARDKVALHDRALHPGLPEPALPPLAALAEPGGAAEQVESRIAVDELAPAAEPVGAFRIVLLISAALWLVGTCVQLVRLIAGAIGLSRLSREVRQRGPQAEELFRRCCVEMNLRRPVHLGIHPTLAAPVFVGGRRPHVLVPADWEQLAPESQRAVLWHELAHAARRDDLAKVAEETLRALFFFHPLVHWLLNRLDAYREQVCDAAAVQRGVAGRSLAQILVDFSRRKAQPGDRVVALRPALPFFHRRTVKNRIHELLAAQTVAGWSAPLVRRQFFGVAAIALLTGIALGGFGARVAGSPAELSATNDTGAQSAAPPTGSVAANQNVRSKTLERILANWKAREERTRSLYFEWENRLFFGQAAEARSNGKAAQQDPRSSRVSEWIVGFDLRRTDTAPLGASAPDASVAAVKTHAVHNGSTTLHVDDPDRKAGWPVATFSHRQNPNHQFRPSGVTLTFHALHAFEVNPHSPQFHVVSEDAVMNGLHCVELQNSNDKPSSLEKCWVDPARDDVVVAYQFLAYFRKRPELVRTIAIEYQRDRVNGWVPARVTVRQPGSLLNELTVTKYTINERFPDDTFSLQVSNGTIVFDERSFERYRPVARGGKIEVVKFDSPASLRIGEVLERRSDFPIEPQSLQDAIDFIAARYQVPIVLKTDDFDAAKIDRTTRVAVRRQGLKIVDLLKDLCSQFRGKQVGFRIEDEVLKISPKFREEGETSIRPALPPLPETASAKERNIQKILEQPVDFTVEPQALKDALDFLAARYQIQVRIDRRIDFTTEVKAACAGIKLRSLLNILLEQCHGDLEFKIERDTLQIVPRDTTR
jgi:beta-lactamase regulating signal transducer with metallopeptidase domain